MTIDAQDLAQALIRCPSVTPENAGAMEVLETALESAGFTCRRMRFGEIENLYARRGTVGPNLCFAGHTDVVPVGNAADWKHEPFAAVIDDGWLTGRGAADMKSAIAAFAAAASKVQVPGSLSFLITGDEEGLAQDGTGPVVQALMAEGERIDHCVLGEPASAARLGDQLKIGRRGSLNVTITVEGRQGHVAYPHLAANPIPVLVRVLDVLQSRVLDEGYPRFPPSNLEITTIDVGNPATNVIPPRASGRINIRFNPAHDGEALISWIEAECKLAGDGFDGRISVAPVLTGNAFITEPGDFVGVCAGAIADVTGQQPELSTTGGISDARFISRMCPVVELGLVGKTMHMVDECVPLADVSALEQIYARLIARYFEAFSA
jgi:succinyl-diaminopimelate desuccinylase